MPRPLRIEYENAWYHVMNRGANHQSIFYNDNHRNIFLSLLAELKYSFHVETHAYCLMDNHYHLLLHTPIANLSRSMRHLDGIYTQRFNRMEKRDGSLFSGRYKAILIDKDSYLLTVSHYIHQNPVAANISKFSAEYIWSSCQDYLELREKQDWLRTDFILKMVCEFRKTYAEFMEEDNLDELVKFYNNNHLPTILGKKDFIENKLSALSSDKLNASLHDVNRTKLVIEPDIILGCLLSYFEINFETVKKSSRGKINLPKIIGILLFASIRGVNFKVCK